MANKETPQGDELSPTLFNIAMMKLPEQLNTLPGTKHALYADDITIWITGGSKGVMQDALQKAADAVQQYTNVRGLQCSPEKPELIILRRKPLEPITIQIKLQGSDIPVVPTIRILGLYI
ncbi:hypothetical protein HPB48_013692 [Haemaphysalis longicornis]|uniref:Reverse transcriptase domain-containing protein n=1 Tax=Haemaphysalis longicornis TaxID=44386 RepID=A0A9J6GH70_HAELO|nr:hypothetical protein HPB48_013692 [Haemaphysalis longicornis]